MLSKQLCQLFGSFHSACLALTIDGDAVEWTAAPDASGQLAFEATVSQPSLWSLENPDLHRAQVLLSDADGRAYDDEVVAGMVVVVLIRRADGQSTRRASDASFRNASVARRIYLLVFAKALTILRANWENGRQIA